MSLGQQIEAVIQTEFNPSFAQLENESHMHAGPAEESHFKLVLVSEAFDGVSKVKRHQAVYKALGDLMPQFHALALHTYTPEEWAEQGSAPNSPLCAGQNK